MEKLYISKIIKFIFDLTLRGTTGEFRNFFRPAKTGENRPVHPIPPVRSGTCPVRPDRTGFAGPVTTLKHGSGVLKWETRISQY
jgi:hypothetical protein